MFCIGTAKERTQISAGGESGAAVESFSTAPQQRAHATEGSNGEDRNKRSVHTAVGFAMMSWEGFPPVAA